MWKLLSCLFLLTINCVTARNEFEGNLRELWDAAEKVIGSKKTVLVDASSEEELDPMCGFTYQLKANGPHQKFRIGPKEMECSYSIRKASPMHSSTVTCSDMLETRNMNQMVCEHDMRVVQMEQRTDILCNEEVMYSVPTVTLRSELTYVTCAFIVEDNAKEKKEGPVGPKDYKKTPQLCPKTCGNRSFDEKNSSTNRIIGGETAERNEFPYQLLILTKGSGGEQMCGGSILNSMFVMSAAHCFKHDTFTSLKFTAVVAGLYKISELKKSTAQIIRGERVIVHPGYKPNIIHNDIALVELAFPIQWTPSISPICLPDPHNRYSGDSVLVSGFGALNFVGVDEEPGDTELPNVLQKATLTVQSPSVCQLAFDVHGIEILTDGQICTRGVDKDTCRGDSGGPLVVKNDEGKLEQVGLVSWGIGCDNPLLPSVNTRVSGYRNWIVDTVTASDRESTCG